MKFFVLIPDSGVKWGVRPRTINDNTNVGNIFNDYFVGITDSFDIPIKPRPNALDFSLYIARQMSSIVECCREGVAKRSRLFTRLGTRHSTDALFDEWVFYGMLCSLLNELQLRMHTLDNARQFCARLHSTRWPNALDTSLNIHVERFIVKSRERLARA